LLSPAFVLLASILYVGVLFAIAIYAEKRESRLSDRTRMIFYCLSFSIYHTAWAFFGAVGDVIHGLYTFLGYNVSAALSAFLWWVVLRKMVRLKDRYRITNIADFISTRYGKSQAVGVVVTLVCLLTVIPYISLQLRSVSTTFSLLTEAGTDQLILSGSGPNLHGAGVTLAIVMSCFTLLFGLRKIDPTERHTGMIFAIGIEAIVKLVAFVAIGIFACWSLHDGIADVFEKAQSNEFLRTILNSPKQVDSYSNWFTSFFMSTFAVLLLPRMFHVAVVENSNERHILPAVWSYQIYSWLISIFVIPIGLAGILLGLSPAVADYFTMELPLTAGQPGLALLVFIGGYSASAAMMITSLTAMSLMLSNYLLLPLADLFPVAAVLRRNQRLIRWISAVTVLCLAYFFMVSAGTQLSLAGAGSRSFAAIVQLAPAAFGGMLWRRANRTGAILGMSGGLLIWVYTLLLPALERSGIALGLLAHGPLGIRFLHPEALLGVSGLDPLPHSMFWSMVTNIGLWIIGSTYSSQREIEKTTASDFHLFTSPQRKVSALQGVGAARSPAQPKRSRIREVLGRYMSTEDADRMLNDSLESTSLAERENLTLEESAALLTEVEKRLSGAIGSAWAHRAIESSEIFDKSEIESLSQSYGRVLAHLQISPTELQRRVDYYREREALLVAHATELQRRIEERDSEIGRREQAEAAQARLTSILETTSDFVAIFDSKARVLYVNRAITDRLKYSPHTLKELCPPDIERLISESAMPTAAREGIWRGDAKLRGETHGSDIEISLVIIAHKAPDGSLDYFSMIARDISEQKRVETNLRHAKESAEAADRLKGEIVATVSHELRTPLNAILGGADLLAAESKLAEYGETLDLIRRNARALASLIDDILTFSQATAGKITVRHEAFLLTELSQEVLNTLRTQTDPKGIAMRLEIAPDVPEQISSDRGRLRQVLMNLVGNAAKFTAQGEIYLRISSLPENELKFEVRDTGLGIPPESLDRLFRPFSQVDSSLSRRYSGTGMGLVVSKKLVEAMGGKIGVASQLGQGSVFWFTIRHGPAPEERSSPSATLPLQEQKPPAHARILIADDSPDNQFIIRRLLKKLGQDCDVVSDGVEAIEAVRGNSYDLVLMDIMMPRLDGIAALREIRAFNDQKAKTPIIAMTARVMKEDCETYRSSGANDVLPKPVDLDSLRAVLARNLKTDF
jgi:PAS domain S-box-containing protein